MTHRRLATLFARHAEPVTITTYERTGSDAHGDPTYDATETATTAFIERVGQQSSTQRDPRGVSPALDVVAFVRDSVAVNAADAEAARASRIEPDGGNAVYQVRTVFDEGNGLIECVCEQLTRETAGGSP